MQMLALQAFTVGVGGFVSRIRDYCGMTQPEFAKAVGVVNPSTVSDWERNVKPPDVPTIERMLKLVDPDLTLEKCLHLPFDPSEEESKYRRISNIVSGISTAALVEPRRAKPVQASPEANRGTGRKRAGPSGQ